MAILTGLIGYPVSHSLSPHIHAYWAKEYGVAADYKLFTTAPARLRQTMLHMRKKNMRGLNITLPHKQAVMEYLDGIDAVATRIGAVNTVVNLDGTFTGTNTDAYGFMAYLTQTLGEIQPYLENVLILGAGGATRAAIVGLQGAGAKSITLANRTETTAKEMAAVFSCAATAWANIGEQLPHTSLLINTTSLGMTGKPPLALDINHLSRKAAVYDIVYSPLQTPLLAQAAAQGNPTVDGLGMLLFQAQKAFECWHGILPEVTEALRDHVCAHIPHD